MNIHAESTLLRIREYYLGKNDVILTPDEMNILNRMEEAYSFMRASKSHTEAVIMLKRRYPEHSKSTLYRDVNAAMALFGDAVTYTKDAMKKLATDHALSLIERSRNVGDRNNESKGLAMLVKINGLDREEIGGEDPMNMLKTPPVIDVPENVLSFLLNVANTGAVNLMDLRNKKQLIPHEQQDTIQPPAAATGPGETEGEVY